MITVDEALACYVNNVAPLPARSVAIGDALHHVLAQSPAVVVDLPPFAQAAVDGYAIHAADTDSATANHPVRLAISGEIAAGVHNTLPALASGRCLRVLTGAPLPTACDAVVMQEHVGREDDCIVVADPVETGTGFHHQGEESKRGDPLGQPGQRVTPGLQAALARAGVHHVDVSTRPRISVLITGDEVMPVENGPHGGLRPGEKYDGNGLLIRSWLRECGYPTPLSIRYVRDDKGAVETALKTAFDEADLVITNGGTSVGDRDYIPAAAEQLGATRLFWRVAQKPGKPLYFARRDKSLLLGLPGNPGAVLVGLVIHARRILDCLEGRATPGPAMALGRLTQPIQVDVGREGWVRARNEVTPEGILLTPLPKQAAHMLSNLEWADALIRVPPGGAALAAGAFVSWTPLYL